MSTILGALKGGLRQAIIAITRERLSPADFKLWGRTDSYLDAAVKLRDALVHWSWGRSTSKPKDLVLVHPAFFNMTHATLGDMLAGMDLGKMLEHIATVVGDDGAPTARPIPESPPDIHDYTWLVTKRYLAEMLNLACRGMFLMSHWINLAARHADTDQESADLSRNSISAMLPPPQDAPTQTS